MDLSIGKLRWLRVSTLVAGVAVLVSACGTSTTGTGENIKNGGTLIWALDADAQSLNPFVAGDVPSVRAYGFLFPNIYQADKNLNIQPDLADGMPSISSDKKVWTVKLRKDAKWSDGSPITADDVVMTVNMQNNPNLDTDVAWHPALGEGGSGAVTKAKAASGVQVHDYADLGYIDMRLNTRKGHLFDNVLTRQAMATALDKPSIVDAATEGRGQVLWGDIVPASWAYDASAVVTYKQDVAKAKSLMTQAGWTVGADGVATRPNPNGGAAQKFVGKIRVRAGKPQRIKAAQIISDQLKAIGIQLTPDPTDFKVFYKPIQQGDFDVAIAGFGLTVDPDDYTTFSSSQLQPEHKSGNNWTGYSNPQLDSLIDQERATIKATDAETKAARKQIFNQMEKIISGDIVTYMLWADKSAMGWSSNVGGVSAGGGDNVIYVDDARNTEVEALWYSKNGK